MKRKTIGVIALTLCVLLAAPCFTACGGSGSTKSALVGTWYSNESEGSFYTFNEDGTGAIGIEGAGEGAQFNYTDKGSSFEYTLVGGTEVQTWNYTIDGDTLSMSFEGTGQVLTYTKK